MKTVVKAAQVTRLAIRFKRGAELKATCATTYCTSVHTARDPSCLHMPNGMRDPISTTSMPYVSQYKYNHINHANQQLLNKLLLLLFLLLLLYL